jgi:enoyl-CoA hydratase/carnithine racemase
MIRTETENGIVHLIIDRPEKKNALTREMYESLSAGVEKAVADTGVNAIVISGAGGLFTAGNDLDDFRARAAESTPRPSAGLAFIETLMHCDLPVIVAVEGIAIGIGVTLLLHCDQVVAAEGARFKAPFVDLGLVPEAASTVTMPMTLGGRTTAALLLMGDTLDADAALAAGLASHKVPAGAAVDAALARARTLVGKPRQALMDSKRLMKAPWQAATKEALEREKAVFTERLRSPECQQVLAGMGRK